MLSDGWWYRFAVTGAWTAPVRLGKVAGATLLILFATFPHRLEYPAHMLGGIGLAGIGIAVLLVVPGSSALGPAAAENPPLGALWVALLVASILMLAVLSDLTLTGPFDLLDVANTTMGGLLGIAAMLTIVGRASKEPAAKPAQLALTGIALGGVGLLLRYPVQDTVKHWWWFGR